MSGALLVFIEILVTMYTITYYPKLYLLLLISGFCLPRTIVAALIVLKNTLDKGKVFNIWITTSTYAIAMSRVYLVYGKEWQMHQYCYSISCINHSITWIFLSLAQFESRPGSSAVSSTCILNSLSPMIVCNF